MLNKVIHKHSELLSACIALQEKTDEMNERINETLSVSGSLLVKLFAREKKEYDSFVKVNEEVTQYALKEARSGRIRLERINMNIA